MKLKFKQQDFQTDAVNAVCALFDGQQRQTTTFSMEQSGGQVGLFANVGVANALCISDEQIIGNMQAVQQKNLLPKTEDLQGRQFSVEMETGTGKTYVYTKTVYELNRLYGFTKFIVVVPSVAIREGVYKSLQTTQEHFSALYDNAPCRYFIYNSSKLSDVRQFATSANIEIMIINIDAFRKAENVINQQQDKLNGDTAISYIQATNPIVIIDEPQSVDNTQKAKEAIASLNPLCIFRYSATHREKVNLLYRLTPVDAYQMGLVKQICVSSNQTASGFNKPYIKLLSVSNENGFKAKVELDVAGKDGKVGRKTVTVKPGADLYKLSGSRDLYEGYALAGIDCTPGMEQIELSNTDVVRLGKAIGDIDENIIKRMQIRRTIEAHLDKELRYLEKGIKVLSLFFIDEVKKYRNEDGGKGIYAQMFEELYAELMGLPKYEPLKSRFTADVSSVHDGYFSQDKKGNYKNTKGDTLDDYNTYNTIMKDKEWLLSFDCPLRFIFSHSALKEGWDNPNVFQVCTLIEQKSTLTARQKVGRGLRLCVNQDGERIEDRNINLLHVMANESFAEFADTLQKEIEDETGVKFGVLQLDLFSGIVYEETKVEESPLTEEQAAILLSHLSDEGFIKSAVSEKETVLPLPKELEAAKTKAVEIIARTGSIAPAEITKLSAEKTVTVQNALTYDDAQELMTHFEEKGYITKTGKIKDSMKTAIQEDRLELPMRFESARSQLMATIRRADTKPPVRDASRDVVVRLKKEVAVSPEFLELWDRIKQKTTYRVQIDEAELTRRSIDVLKNMESIPKARIVTQTADIQIDNPGVTYTERGIKTAELIDSYASLPNILAVIGAQTLTKRATIYEILMKSGRMADFLNNPQLFIENATQIILDVRRSLAVDGISYKKLYGEEYYVQEVFDSAELIANLDRNAVAVEHSVYDHVVYDSEIESHFARDLDDDPDVKMFFKLPGRFKVDTPIGSYNPDWAVYVEIDGVKKLYFVLETKGGTSLFNLRESESMKIRCGKAHFKAIDTEVSLHTVTRWRDFKVQNV